MISDGVKALSLWRTRRWNLASSSEEERPQASGEAVVVRKRRREKGTLGLEIGHGDETRCWEEKQK